MKKLTTDLKPAGVTLATKTLFAIEKQISGDQGAKYRGYLKQVMPTMDDAYSEHTFPFRSHLGASGIGDECARKIWYGFRWTTIPSFGGRMIRLFNRGHLEEARFISMLLAIGCQIYQQDENGNQYRISDAGGHFGGSGDGIGFSIPDAPPNTPVLLEFKTSSSKMFTKLKTSGVKIAKFEHYVQMNTYMRKMGIAIALYMCVNKDNDELYAEIVSFDPDCADEFIERGVKLVFEDNPPPKMSESAAFWKCKFCDHKEVCHRSQAPEVNCRTCIHSVTEKDGTWSCNNFNTDITLLDKNAQFKGCDKYRRKF